MEKDYSAQKNWYIIQTSPGFEGVAKQNLDNRIKSMNMEDKIFQVLIPEETYTTENSKGIKVEKVRKTYPGYIFIEMIVDHESWFIVRNTPSVTGVLGSSGKGTLPVPLSPEEINPILESVGIKSVPEENEEVIEEFTLEVGDSVIINTPSFDGVISKIESIDEHKRIVKCYVELFGRKVLYDVSFDEVEPTK